MYETKVKRYTRGKREQKGKGLMMKGLFSKLAITISYKKHITTIDLLMILSMLGSPYHYQIGH